MQRNGFLRAIYHNEIGIFWQLWCIKNKSLFLFWIFRLMNQFMWKQNVTGSPFFYVCNIHEKKQIVLFVCILIWWPYFQFTILMVYILNCIFLNSKRQILSVFYASCDRHVAAPVAYYLDWWWVKSFSNSV